MRVTTHTASYQRPGPRFMASTESFSANRDEVVLDSPRSKSGGISDALGIAGCWATLGATLFAAGLAASRFQMDCHGLLGAGVGGAIGLMVGASLVAPLSIAMTVKEDGMKLQSFVDGAGLALITGGGVGGFTAGLCGLAGGHPLATATAGVLTAATGFAVMATLTE